MFAWIAVQDWGPPWQELQLIALAGGLGAILGLEREIAAKPAGLRTHILVCSGASLLMLLGDLIIAQFSSMHPAGMLSTDPLRILQAIVVGIGFLGAGTIIHQGGEYVEGLTTAASILLTASIGMAVAIGQTGLALGATLFVAAVLFLVGWLETLIRKLRRRWRRRWRKRFRERRSEQKHAEQEHPEQKQAEQEHPEQKQAEQEDPEQEHPEQS